MIILSVALNNKIMRIKWNRKPIKVMWIIQILVNKKIYLYIQDAKKLKKRLDILTIIPSNSCKVRHPKQKLHKEWILVSGFLKDLE